LVSFKGGEKKKKLVDSRGNREVPPGEKAPQKGMGVKAQGSSGDPRGGKDVVHTPSQESRGRGKEASLAGAVVYQPMVNP